MNKRYIDFVPTAKNAEVEPKVKARTARPAPKAKAAMATAVRVKKSAPTRVMPAKATPRTRRVVSTDVMPAKKRVSTVKAAPKMAPKMAPKANTSSVGVKITKAATFTDEKKPKKGQVEDLSRHFVKTEVTKRPLSKLEIPKSPLINQAKIEKRPLSKTVYTKKVVVPKEKKQEPVTIITKPEKQSHVGVIVAVILTIILGAAAGTVAFLLLPK